MAMPNLMTVLPVYNRCQNSVINVKIFVTGNNGRSDTNLDDTVKFALKTSGQMQEFKHLTYKPIYSHGWFQIT